MMTRLTAEDGQLLIRLIIRRTQLSFEGLLFGQLFPFARRRELTGVVVGAEVSLACRRISVL